MNIKHRLLETQYELQYQAQRLAQAVRFSGLRAPGGEWPVLLGLSFPKSGTNLLRQVLAGFAKAAPFSDRSFDVFTAFDAETGREKSPQEALAFLKRLHPGDIAQAHFLAWPEVMDAATHPCYIPYFIYRDPRDVVVSHVFYVTKMAPEHIHHKYYAEVLKTFDERLCVSIMGRPDAGVDFPDIGQRFQPYMGWLDCPEVLSLRFEDFILNRKPTLERVLDHFCKSASLSTPRQQMLDWLEESIQPEKSPTFRSGKTGEWKKHFKDEHKALFKQVSGDLLVRLGYESNNDW